ncbi:MAG TPA: vWA domain-containing protein [Anaerolineae bacterium]|nr:vWA domain-containing protein [Anaerolineae bacterium]
MLKSAHSAHSRETGQAIILIVFVFIGLLAAVGIVVDLGRYLVATTQLRRAADAAALAGAAQFRVAGSTLTPEAVYDKVNRAARASLSVHGVATPTLESDLCPVDATEGTCVATGLIDPSLITNPPSKKVRVRLAENLPLVFLRLVGINSVPISAESTTEAAAVDVVLAIDTSDSMASDTLAAQGSGIGDYQKVYACDHVTTNPLNTDCYPFYEVKAAALSFLDYLSAGYDRVSVIPFALEAGYCINVGDVWPYCAASAYNKYVPLTTDLNAARTFLANLDIAIPAWAGSPPPSPAPPCPSYQSPYYDPRLCTNTNIGAGLRAAATELLKEFDPNYSVIDVNAGPNHPSKERLRVIILLTDGATNASGLGAEGATYGEPDGLPGLAVQGFCPRYTWVYPPTAPFCRAVNPVLTGPKADILASRHISGSVYYDAVDYALDWADFAMLNEEADGNGIVMFTIGLGNQVITAPFGDPVVGEKLLRYIAAGGDDGRLETDPCAGIPNSTLAEPKSCGNYYFAPSGPQLLNIFKAIAGRIFTRINQ